MKRFGVLVILSGVLVAGIAFGQTKLPSAAGTIAIGGKGGWDYAVIDSLSHRLYVAHGSNVPVIDLERNKRIADIANTPWVHGIAIADDLDRGFISDGGDSSVTVFDLQTDSVLSRVRVTGSNPDAILYEPLTHRVFTFNGESSNATVIDGRSLNIVGTIPLDGKPEFAVSDNRGAIFCNIEYKGEVMRIDARDLSVTGRYSLEPCKDPTGMAIDQADRRLFVVGRNRKMAVMDADNGKVIATLPIGAGVDGVAYDPATHEIFSSNGDGTMTVIRQEGADKYVVAGNVPTVRGARTLALDELTHRLYLPVGTPPGNMQRRKSDFRVLVYQQ